MFKLYWDSGERDIIQNVTIGDFQPYIVYEDYVFATFADFDKYLLNVKDKYIHFKLYKPLDQLLLAMRTEPYIKNN